MKKEKSLDEMRRSTATTHGKEHEVGINTQTLAKEAPDPRIFAIASEDELAPILRRFYGELKTQGGKPLTSGLNLLSRDVTIAPWKGTEKHVLTYVMDSFGCINGISTLVGGQSTRALIQDACLGAGRASPRYVGEAR